MRLQNPDGTTRDVVLPRAMLLRMMRQGLLHTGGDDNDNDGGADAGGPDGSDDDGDDDDDDDDDDDEEEQEEQEEDEEEEDDDDEADHGGGGGGGCGSGGDWPCYSNEYEDVDADGDSRLDFERPPPLEQRDDDDQSSTMGDAMDAMGDPVECVESIRARLDAEVRRRPCGISGRGEFRVRSKFDPSVSGQCSGSVPYESIKRMSPVTNARSNGRARLDVDVEARTTGG